MEVTKTKASEAGEYWLGAGNNKIPKLGEMKVDWIDPEGKQRAIRLKAGHVGQTLFATERLKERGWESLLTMDEPRLYNVWTGEVIPVIRKKGQLPQVDMWCWVQKNSQVKTVQEEGGTSQVFKGQAKGVLRSLR